MNESVIKELQVTIMDLHNELNEKNLKIETLEAQVEELQLRLKIYNDILSDLCTDSK